MGVVASVVLLWLSFTATSSARGRLHPNEADADAEIGIAPDYSPTSASEKPNIFVIMVDDLGWANVGYHNDINAQIYTPNIDALAQDGLRLNRLYVYRGCAPSRSSFQTGRFAQHVAPENDDGIVSPTHGIPVAMTTVASKLKSVGYSTYLIGKWDAGFASYAHLPNSKGYDYFFGYLGKAIGYFDGVAYNSCPNTNDVDLWEDDHPAFESQEAMLEALAEEPGDEGYVEFTFKRKVEQILAAHGEGGFMQGQPFFLEYSSHLPHFPAQVPEEWLESDIYGTDESWCSKSIDFIYPDFDSGYAFECRTATQSQVNLLDVLVGEVVDALRDAGLWDNTLVVFQSDNGGHVQTDSGAGNNWPLRGGKETDFEGGVRAISFVTGGLLPDARRGDVETGYVHTCDWYTTFCELAGVDATDEAALAAGLPPIDGMNMWPLISGEVRESPRTEMLISDTTLISGDWKFMQAKFRYAVWQSPVWPMASTPSQDVLEDTVLDCVGNHGDAPCLFNIREDESEYVNVAHLFPDTTKQLQARLEELKAGFLDPPNLGTDSCPDDYLLKVTVGTDNRNQELGCGCWMALYNYNGFDGPYQDLEDTHIRFDHDALPLEAIRGPDDPLPSTHDGGHEEHEHDEEHDKEHAAEEHEHEKVDREHEKEEHEHEQGEHEHEKVDREHEKEEHEHEQGEHELDDFSDQFEHEQVDHIGDYKANGHREEELLRLREERLRHRGEGGGDTSYLVMGSAAVVATLSVGLCLRRRCSRKTETVYEAISA